jgi:hypothetical protein
MKRLALLMVLLGFVLHAPAALLDFFKRKPAAETNGAVALGGFSQEQMAQALKDALGNGVAVAVTNLARPGGFLSNAQVRIPMPEKLQSVEKTLRALKQDRYADEFVATMNHAAESAVPEALPIFTDALKSMTIDDAKKLVTGSNDSATVFFKSKGEDRIQEKMMPVIREATERAGVTAAYKKLMDQAGGGTSFLSRLFDTSFDVDKYVAQKASDGLFTMIAEEEKRIRENPAARTTELLQKVFGAVKP